MYLAWGVPFSAIYEVFLAKISLNAARQPLRLDSDQVQSPSREFVRPP